MRKLILTLGLFTALGVYAQETVKVTANKFNGYGIVYSLPKTAIDVRATVTRSVEKPGPFAQFAQKYLGQSPTVTQERTVWQIENVDILPKGIADPEKKYAIQLKKENRTAFYLNEEGMLVSINRAPAPASTRPAPMPKAEEAAAVECGYRHLWRYNPELEAEGKNPFTLDSKEPQWDKFEDFLKGEVRYASVMKQYPAEAEQLFAAAKENAMWRYNNYKRLAKQQWGTDAE